MSWSFKLAGKPEDVKASVGETQAPDCVKQAVAQVCDGIDATAISNHPHITGVFAEGFGHFGLSDYWNGVTLKIEGIFIAPCAQEPSPADTALPDVVSNLILNGGILDVPGVPNT